jgi:hypothetical protein
MDEVFDPQDIIFEKAKQFIGEKVVTVTWRPEIFKATHWFRDIFLWEINNPPKHQNEISNSFINTGLKTYLNCPFSEKDECKALGGKWDANAKKWFVPDGTDIGKFERWLPQSKVSISNKGLDTDIPF